MWMDTTDNCEKREKARLSACPVCKGLSRKYYNAKAKNDLEELRIAYDQMRDHLKRVKYPAKHGL